MENKQEEQQVAPEQTPTIKHKAGPMTVLHWIVTGILLILVVFLYVRLTQVTKSRDTVVDQVKERVEDRLEDRRDSEDDNEVTDEDGDGNEDDDGQDEVAELESYYSHAFGFSFDIPAGYDLENAYDEIGTDPYFDIVLDLLRIEDPAVVAAYANSSEGYPNISVHVMDNPNSLDVTDWAEENVNWTNFDEAYMIDNDYDEVTIDGVEGIAYDWSGLGNASVLILPIQNGKFMLMIQAYWYGETHPVQNDVLTIVETLSL